MPVLVSYHHRDRRLALAIAARLSDRYRIKVFVEVLDPGLPRPERAPGRAVDRQVELPRQGRTTTSM
jgi:hypothetical protein